MESKEEGLPGWVRDDLMPAEVRKVPFGTASYHNHEHILCVCAFNGEARWYAITMPMQFGWEHFNPVPPGLSLKETMQYVEVVARLL